MIRQIVVLGLRSDPAGDGRFGAPRAGGRTHKGVDFVCHPGSAVLAPAYGRITKHGTCYADDPAWKYVQVTDAEGRDHRLFYVEPTLPVGTLVTPDSPVGRAQNIASKYPGQGMTPHVHYEVKVGDGFVDPTPGALA